jgi:hypothetical protein
VIEGEGAVWWSWGGGGDYSEGEGKGGEGREYILIKCMFGSIDGREGEVRDFN